MVDLGDVAPEPPVSDQGGVEGGQVIHAVKDVGINGHDGCIVCQVGTPHLYARPSCCMIGVHLNDDPPPWPRLKGVTLRGLSTGYRSRPTYTAPYR